MGMREFRLLAAAPLALFAAGCALLPHAPAHWAAARPVAMPAENTADQNDGNYAAAAAAIDQRRYDRALEFLQLARAHKADDVRVLNAFGVVYDKLGRFDLSARYYAQARALAPDSSIIANNQAYSQVMQGQVKSGAVLLAEARAPADLQVAALPEPAPILTGAGAIRLQINPSATQVKALAGVTGHTLVIIDASGRKNGAEPVLLALAARGWSTPRAIGAESATQGRTTISYAPASALAARGLANTLPSGARLEPCPATCDGIRLTLGADATRRAFPRFSPAGHGR